MLLEAFAVFFLYTRRCPLFKKRHKACRKVNREHHLEGSENTANGSRSVILSITRMDECTGKVME